ncbi:hypothetical protein IK1_04101 [Bacillus cereus VD146]|uniref:Uncharacterized protein n=1 Tax=Bacillus cereus (strain VD146) TaxID=1053236 RepID=R8NIN9_BACCX|nr:hypothetical protein IC3_05107 [Bacillus cereus VD142]EOP46366.1 hypothetical protein IK1_04101 [Bacillus cereus VD146]
MFLITEKAPAGTSLNRRFVKSSGFHTLRPALQTIKGI